MSPVPEGCDQQLGAGLAVAADVTAKTLASLLSQSTSVKHSKL